MTSSKDREKWVVPGGGMEPTEESHTTAEREALEEAGVRGTLGRYLGMFEVHSHKKSEQPKISIKIVAPNI